MDVNLAFSGLCEKLHIEICNAEDAKNFINSLTEDSNRLLKSLMSANSFSSDVVCDLLHLIEFAKQESLDGNSDGFNSILACIVSRCLSCEYCPTLSVLLCRLYRRGFEKDVVCSMLDYFNSSVLNENRFFCLKDVQICNLGSHETTLKLCCNLLRASKRALFINKKGYFGIFTKIVEFNVVVTVLGILMNSYICADGKYNTHALFNLFHPLSRSSLPVEILCVVIDQLPARERVSLFNRLVTIWSDGELLEQITETHEISITICFCRLLYVLGRDSYLLNNVDFDNITANITNGINLRLGSFEHCRRICAMALAEAFDLFVMLTEVFTLESQDEDEFELGDAQEEALEATSLFLSSCCCITSAPLDSSEDIYFRIYKNTKCVKLERSPVFSKGSNNIKKVSEARTETPSHEILENEHIIDEVFRNVPRLNAETVESYAKDCWTTPPQHIIQCYERLSGKPARGDVDFEALLASDVCKPNAETLKNKLLRIGQILVYLPGIIEKGEPILHKFAAPISAILIKLDDLQIYKDVIVEVKKRANFPAIIDGDSGCNVKTRPGSDAYSLFSEGSNNFELNTPEHLIYASLIAICVRCPLEMIRFYSCHLLKSEYSITQQVMMILCMQHAAKKISDSRTSKEIRKELNLEYNMELPLFSEKSTKSKHPKGVSNVISYRVVEAMPDSICIDRAIDRPKKVESLAINQQNINSFSKIASQAINCLLSALLDYAKGCDGKKNHQYRVSDEVILIGIIETIITFIDCSASICDGVLNDCLDMVSRFSKLSNSRRFSEMLRSLAAFIYVYRNKKSH